MDSETVHGTVRSGVTRCRRAGRYSGGQWTLDGSGRSMATAACVAPPTDWRGLPGKGLNTATGAAGEGCNEKAAFITPEVRRLKGVYEICFF